MRRAWMCALALTAVALVGPGTGVVGAQGTTAPSYSATGELILPSDFREWVFVGTSLGMTYGPATRKGPSVFENIYVTRDAYRAFMQSGTWPEKTMFVMEGRAADSHELLANTGQSAGEALFIEASVKDSTRYPDTTWAYFNYGDGKKPSASAKPIPKTASCYACHDQNTAVEYSFAQFYPAVFEAAKRLGTVKPTYDPKKKF
ncbi:MAG: cytochrome P460 family protein [Vicinamibacterales bacterium]